MDLNKLMSVIEQQMSSNPEEFKKLKRKMKKWSKSPDGHKKISNLTKTMTGLQQEAEEEKEPREILRKRLKNMKDKRTGRK